MTFCLPFSCCYQRHLLVTDQLLPFISPFLFFSASLLGTDWFLLFALSLFIIGVLIALWCKVCVILSLDDNLYSLIIALGWQAISTQVLFEKRDSHVKCRFILESLMLFSWSWLHVDLRKLNTVQLLLPAHWSWRAWYYLAASCCSLILQSLIHFSCSWLQINLKDQYCSAVLGFHADNPAE